MEKRKNQIPIKNLFYMLCYAWNVLAIMDDIKVDKDDYDNTYDLLARVFTFGVSRLVKSGFRRSYIEEIEELATLRGKISIQESMNRMSMQRKKLVCTFDEYSINDTFNQIIKYTIESLIKNSNVNNSTKKDLKKQSVFFSGIESKAPTKENRKKLKNNKFFIVLVGIKLELTFRSYSFLNHQISTEQH
jgi:5-methylcytosine-specific restriction enzyme subunit McrC